MPPLTAANSPRGSAPTPQRIEQYYIITANYNYGHHTITISKHNSPVCQTPATPPRTAAHTLSGSAPYSLVWLMRTVIRYIRSADCMPALNIITITEYEVFGVFTSPEHNSPACQTPATPPHTAARMPSGSAPSPPAAARPHAHPRPASA